METFTPTETRIKSSDVLLKSDEFVSAVDTALDHGVIKVVKVGDGTEVPEGISPIHFSTKISPDQIVFKDDGKAPERIFGSSYYVDAGKFELTDDAKKTETDTLHKRIVINVANGKAPWYMNDDLLDKKISRGDELSEIFKVKAGETEKDLMNFSGRKLTEAQLEDIRQAIEQSVHAAGATVLDSVSGIAILSHDELNGRDDGKEKDKGNTLGLFQNWNHVLFLSDILLTEDPALVTDKYGVGADVPRLKTTLIHELGHALQANIWETHAKGLGWSEKRYEDVVDDYGRLKTGTVHSLGKAALMQDKFVDGGIAPVPLEEVLEGQDPRAVKPNTGYGGTQPMEDFAESFVPYALEGRYTDKIDNVRKNSIGVTSFIGNTQYATSEYGPFQVAISPVDLSRAEKQPIEIEPRTLYVVPGAEVIIDKDYKYKKHRDIVDDYGNELTVTSKAA